MMTEPRHEEWEDRERANNDVASLQAEMDARLPAGAKPAVALSSDDLARNAEADLAIADAATPGPWERRDRFVGAESYHALTDVVGHVQASPFTGKPWSNTPVCRISSGFVWFEGDCAFIPMARTALPAWIRRAATAEARAEALQRFKSWCHGWLDAVGVPHDPDPEHTAENGCRISGRMRFLLNRATTAEVEVARLQGIITGMADRIAAQSELLTEHAEREE